MCLNSYSFINEQPFSNSISILNFLPIFLFLKCFCRYLKMWKIANLGYGNGRISKAIYPIYMIFGRHMQKTNIYKTKKSFFWFLFQILNNVTKFPDWPLPGTHGNRIKNPASWFCANCSYVPPYQFWKYCENWFLSYVCYRVRPIRGLAWLPWQPDWNDNYFQKVRVMGFVVVYHPCGLAFRKVLKFDVENWAVDHWTPLKSMNGLCNNFIASDCCIRKQQQ